MSPLTVNVRIALVPSIVAATTLLSLPDEPVILTVAFAASAVSPISISKSLLLPAHIIEAVAVAQEELFPVLSQLKSISFELPVVLNVPVKVAPFTSNFKTLLLPT